MNISLTPKNENNLPHGLWVKYSNHNNNIIIEEGLYINGLRHGYFEVNYDDGRLMYKGNYIKEEKIGLWFYGNKHYEPRNSKIFHIPW